MILSHFSPEPFIFDPNFKYTDKKRSLNSTRIGKPYGLWLSDESADGWKQWCESESYNIKGLKYETKYKLTDLKNILILNTDYKLHMFDHKYSKSIYPECISIRMINWEEIKKEYSGIIISPYAWKFRLDIHWYYSWDCASACIWDLSVLEPLK